MRNITLHIPEQLVDLIDRHTQGVSRSQWIAARIVESLYFESLLGRREYDRIAKTMRFITEVPPERRDLSEAEMRRVVKAQFAQWMKAQREKGKI